MAEWGAVWWVWAAGSGSGEGDGAVVRPWHQSGHTSVGHMLNPGTAPRNQTLGGEPPWGRWAPAQGVSEPPS